MSKLVEMPLITKKGKNVYADDKPLKTLSVQAVRGNLVFLREPNENRMMAQGWTMIYFMDSEEAAKAMAHGDLPYLMFPRGTWPAGSPILDIWKKKFNPPGTEHILGALEANTMPYGIFLDMLSVRPGYQRNTIAQKMIQLAMQEFPDAEVSHSSPTDKGRGFLKKNQLLEPRYQTPEDREDMINDLDEGFHDRAKLEVYHYSNDIGHSFWFFRNGMPAGEVQLVDTTGHMMGFGVQRSLQGTGFGRAMLGYVFEKTGLPQLKFASSAHAFYHKVGGERKGRADFILSKDKFKSSSLSFKEIPKEQVIQYLKKGKLDPWPSRN